MEFVLSFLRFLVALPAALVRYIEGWLHFRRLANRFPGPPGLPLLGNIAEMFPLSDIERIKFFTDNVIRYRTGQFRIGPIRLFFINDPRDIQCYVNNSKNQNKVRMIMDVAAEITGGGLLTQSGDRYERLHKIIAPTFHKEKLNTFMSIFNHKTDVHLELIGKHANGKKFDVIPLNERLTMDIAIESLLGISFTEQEQDSGTWYYLHLGQYAISHRLLRPWLYSSAIFYNLTSWGRKLKEAKRVIQELLRKVIQERAQILEETRKSQGEADEDDDQQNAIKKRSCMLDDLLLSKEKGIITDEELEEEVTFVTSAGFETIYLALSFASYLLAKNPNVQNKIVSELKSIFGENENVEVTMEMLPRMKYLGMVIKEILRLHPPVWIVTRKAEEDTCLKSCDLVIPAGANVLLSTISVHMDPEVFPNPEQFDPERWSAENCAERNPCAFLPFIAGQRACLGRKYAINEIKVILSKLLWKFEVLPDPTYQPEMFWAISSPPKNGVWIKIQNRRK